MSAKECSHCDDLGFAVTGAYAGRRHTGGCGESGECVWTRTNEFTPVGDELPDDPIRLVAFLPRIGEVLQDAVAIENRLVHG
jgi:hypothetical protein